MKPINWRRMWLATQIFLGLVAVMALGIWFLEPFGWAWRAASAIVLAAAWWIIFRLCEIVLRRAVPVIQSAAPYGRAVSLRHPKMQKRFRTSAFASNSGSSPQGNRFEFVRPPKSARHTYVLTEAGVPVGVEYDRRAVDNWIGLGDEFEAIPHDLRRRLA